MVDLVEAYENWRETQTLDELHAIRHNPNSIHMESLVIRERILGINNPELPHPIVFRGAVFADDARFDRCISLWLHALRLRQRMNLSVAKDLLRFAQVFSQANPTKVNTLVETPPYREFSLLQVLHVGLDLPFEVLEEVLAATVTELERNRYKLAHPGPKDDVEVIAVSTCAVCIEHIWLDFFRHAVFISFRFSPIQEEMDCNVTTALYLVTITTKLMSKATQQQEHNIYKHVYRLNLLDARTKEGSSLLHLAASVDTPVDEFHTSDICRLVSLRGIFDGFRKFS